FPAEDGIRDFHVTGVQTCALPISSLASSEGWPLKPATRIQRRAPLTLAPTPGTRTRTRPRIAPPRSHHERRRSHSGSVVRASRKIGRASGRERAEGGAGGGWRSEE